MLKPVVDPVTHAKIKFVPGLGDSAKLRAKLEKVLDEQMVDW